MVAVALGSVVAVLLLGLVATMIHGARAGRPRSPTKPFPSQQHVLRGERPEVTGRDAGHAPP